MRLKYNVPIALMLLLILSGLSTVHCQIRVEEEKKPVRAARVKKAAPGVRVTVHWEGERNVIVHIGGENLVMSGGAARELRLHPGEALKVSVETPGKTYYAEEFLVLEEESGEVYLSVEGDYVKISSERLMTRNLESDQSEDSQYTDTESAMDEEIFRVVEQMPRFPGCENIDGTQAEKKACADKKMFGFLYDNMRYPDDAREKGIEGPVVVGFVVEKDGSLTDPKIVKDLGDGLGEESIRLVKMMDNLPHRWMPGRDHGKPVRVQYILPIFFRLN